MIRGEVSDQLQTSVELAEVSADFIDARVGSEHRDEEDAASSEDEGPLTKAVLLTFADMNSPWISVGTGVVSVAVVIESASGSAAEPTAPAVSGGGKVGKAEGQQQGELMAGLVSHRVGRLEMVELENPDEVLISTPIDVEGVYQVRDDDTLVWDDAQLGRTMAFKFSHAAGCEKILREITDYQLSELSKQASMGSVGQAGGKVGSPDGARATDRFAVSVDNLAGIAGAVSTNPLVFGSYVRDDMTYFRQLSALFDTCAEAGDTVSMDRIAEITLSLLGSPYNSEGKILGQFMESAYVDKCVDIVQYALGRRDKASGFVSFEERRATFKDPLHLPEPILQRIHLLYSALYLRDLLPLSLDDGDGGSPCVLNLLLLRFKFALINEICSKPEFLQHAFERSQEPDPDRATLYPLVAFVHDMSKMVKNAPIPLDIKEELYNTMIQAGLLPFCRSVLRCGLHDVAAEQGRAAAREYSTEAAMSLRSDAAKAVEASCDVLSHCLFVVPSARDHLKSESEEHPTQCSLALVMRSFAVMRYSSTLQAAYDVVLGAAVGVQALQVFHAFVNPGAQRAIIRFLVEGSGVESPPLFLLASHVAELLTKPIPPGEGQPGPLFFWTHGDEIQLVYGIRVLSTIAEKVEEGFRTSFTEIVKLSGILAAARTVMAQARARRLENVQSSIVSFLTQLIAMGDGNVVKLFDSVAGDGAGTGLLSVCMALFLQCSRRNTILSASLGALFVHLCSEVHHEKLHLVEAAAISPSALPPSFVTPMDGSNPLCPDLAQSSHDDAALGRFQQAASALMAAYGEQLDEQAPVVADRLRTSLKETPEEAKQAEAETSSMPSTIARPTDGLSEYDMLAVEFGVDMPLPSSATHSPLDSPLSEAAVGPSEDSLLSELAEMESAATSEDTETEEETGSSNSDSDSEEPQGRGRSSAKRPRDDEPVPPPVIDDSDSSSTESSSSHSNARAPTEEVAPVTAQEAQEGDNEESSLSEQECQGGAVRAAGQKRTRDGAGDEGNDTAGKQAPPSHATVEASDNENVAEEAEEPPARKPKAQRRRR